MLMVGANLIAPLFFLGRLEAKIILGAFLAVPILMTLLTSVAGFTRLLGLGHVPWFPLIYFLWMRLDQIPADDFLGVWIRALVLINGTSLMIDVIDVIRYIAGERGETVAGLAGGK